MASRLRDDTGGMTTPAEAVAEPRSAHSAPQASMRADLEVQGDSASPTTVDLSLLMQPGAEDASAGEHDEPSTRTPLLSIVMPMFNEEQNVAALLEELHGVLARCEAWRFEVLVVDDGSTDRSGEIAKSMGARVCRHAQNLGNGAAIKRGIREARGDYILMMDGDGQHPPDAIPTMLQKLEHFDHVVGSRGGSGGSVHRNLANRVYNGLASYVTSKNIRDLTSGFRVARADVLKGFVHLLPNTFSYPTTITLAMIKAGYSVHYEPIAVRRRGGHSKIRLISDGSRFFLIILKVATFFSPLRVFVPLSAFFAAMGLAWYVHTWWTTQRFTNMGLLLLVQASVMFALGLISEQVAQLRFERTEPSRHDEER